MYLTYLRVNSCPELNQPLPGALRLESAHKRKTKQCWGGNGGSPSAKPNISKHNLSPSAKHNLSPSVKHNISPSVKHNLYPSPAKPTNVCHVFTEGGDITLCTRVSGQI